MSLRVAIVSPVMPIWNHGVFCSSFTKLYLAKGFQITLFNTFSLFPSNSTFSNNSVIEILPFITEKLERYFKEPLVFVGFSMAGTLVQMLAARFPNVHAILVVNATGYLDALLQERLG
ncbi:hypothetical protein MCQ_01151 [Candidatus Bartonella washoeensis Sb944nv]|uniref:AB hydrolase-1 domain-containing protein n=1 Tax=Candidatus Bartonella washoeensis Sb944nv TaxID=1094563 RepID=J1J3S5_9HYPH|nr:hypothetical protein MCQ_01151 [Bartonella washoeensis Sb944nv]